MNSPAQKHPGTPAINTLQQRVKQISSTPLARRGVFGLLMATLALGLPLSQPVQATSVTWDGTGSGGTGDGTGVWNTATKWYNGTSDVVWASGNDAVFGHGGAGGNVTLTAPTTAQTITFNSFTGTYTLGTLAQALTINAGLTMNIGAGAVTVISPVVLGGSQIWTNNSAGLLTVSGTLDDGLNTFSLTKSGTGAMTLTASNTFDGGVTLNAGRLTLSNNGALGTGTFTINGGTIDGNNVTIANAQIWNGDFTYGANTSNLNLGTNTVSLTNNVKLTANANSTRILTVGGIISGAHSLTKDGLGQLTLNGASNFSGGLIILSGTVLLGNASATPGTGTITLGDTASNNNSVLFTNNATAGTSDPFIINAGSTGTITIQTNGNNLPVYSGTVALNNDLTVMHEFTGTKTTTFSGLVTQNSTAHTITVGSANIGGVTFSGGIAVGTGGLTLAVSSGATTAAGGLLQITGGVTSTTTGNLILQNNSSVTDGIILSGSTVNNAGSITNSGTGSGSVTISAAIGASVTGVTQSSATSLLTLSGANTFAGNTLVSTGTLALANNLALQNSAIDTAGSGVITLTVTTPTFGGLLGSKDLASVLTTGYSSVTSLTLNPGAAVTGTYSGVIANGAMAVTKTGAGAQTLSGSNTYSGITTVNAGTLKAANVQALGTSALATALSIGAARTVDLATDTSINAYNTTITASGATIASDRATSGTGITHTLGNLALGAFQLNVTAGSNVTSGTAGLTFGTTTFSAGTIFDTAAGTNLTLGSLNSNATFTKQGAGQLTLSTNAGARSNQATTLTAGTLRVTAAQAIETGNGAFNFNGGTLSVGVDTSGTIGNGGATVVGANPMNLEIDRNTAGAGVTDTFASLSIGTQLNLTKGSNVTSGTAGAIFTTTTLTGNTVFDTAANTSLTLGQVGGASFAITKQGAGTMTLSTVDTFGGGVTLSAGTLTFGNNSALGTGALTITGGSIDVSGNATTANTQNWNGDFTFIGSTNVWTTGTAAVTLGTDVKLTVSNNTLTVAGIISGAHSLTKDGPGQLTLTGTSAFNGGLGIKNGTVFFHGAGSIITAGTITLGDTVSNNNSVTFNNDASAGTSAPFIINAGTTGTITLETTSNAGPIYSGSVALNNDLTVSHAGTASKTTAFSGLVTEDSTAHTITVGSNNTGGVTFSGGIAVGTGGLTVAVSNGATTGAAGLLAITGGVTSTSTGNLTLQNNGSVANAINLSGSSVNNTGAVTNSGTGSGSVTISAAIGSNVTGVTQNSATSLLTLSGSSSYAGTTTVSQGTLVVSGSIAGTSAVNVASGATLTVNGAVNSGALTTVGGTLNGRGNLGAVTVIGGGTLAPGTSTTDIINANGDFNLNSGAHLTIELGGTSAGGGGVSGYDQVKVSGNSRQMTLAGDLQLSLVNGFIPNNGGFDSNGNIIKTGDMFFIAIYSGAGGNAIAGGGFSNLTAGTSFSGNYPTIAVNGQIFALSYTGDATTNTFSGAGNDVVLIAIPEPGTYALMLSAFGILIFGQGLRRQSRG